MEPYYDDGSGKEPRYYQRNAINSAVEAIAKGQDRVLLVMATGTGKTYTAFQIIRRLWKSNWHADRQKRVLFLADRNILVNQTMVNDFRPFGAKMAKLSTQAKTIERDDGTRTEITLAVDKYRRIDTAYEIYLGLYQALTGPEERQKIFRELSPDFFDLIIIDECHRGSAAEDAAWREILDHFKSATQIDLTATPKETEYVPNIHYFGPPVNAPPPARLIARGKYGISVWSTVLLDKFLYGRPSHRLLQDLADHGLHMPAGTLAGGLKAIAPLFEPLEQAMVLKAAQRRTLAR